MKEVKREAKELAEKRTVKRPVPAWLPWAAAGLSVLAVGGLGFVLGRTAGTGYRGTGSDRDEAVVRGSSFGMRGGGMMGGTTRSAMGASGEVTAISSDSISIKDTRRGGTITYRITADTKVTDNGTAKAVGDIKTGNRVWVHATGTDTAAATTIELGTN